MLRNLIFDWSGTLVDDLAPVIGATNRVLRDHGLPELTREEFRRRFRLPFTEFYHEVLPGVPLEELDARFHETFVQLQHAVTPLPGAFEFLEYCRSSGRRLFLLSSIKREHWEEQSARLGVEPFFEQAYVAVMDKRAMIGRILQDHRLDPAETAFVGDMIHDVETARHGGVMSIAVLTGYDSIEKLTPSRPDMVVASLHELCRAMQSDAPARPTATVGALLHREGKVLMIRTHKWGHRWGIPGGKIRRGESSEAALRREILEETALPIDQLRFVMCQDAVDSPEFHLPAHFLLLNYLAEAAPGPVLLNHEAQEFAWLSPEEALALDLNHPTRVLLEEVLAQGWLER